LAHAPSFPSYNIVAVYYLSLPGCRSGYADTYACAAFGDGDGNSHFAPSTNGNTHPN